MTDNIAQFWTLTHLENPVWATDLVLRKKDITDNIRIHLADIRASMIEIDHVLCWNFEDTLWLEDKYNTVRFYIAAQTYALKQIDPATIPQIKAMAERKLQEYVKRKELLQKLIKNGINIDLISWEKIYSGYTDTKNSR